MWQCRAFVFAASQVNPIQVCASCAGCLGQHNMNPTSCSQVSGFNTSGGSIAINAPRQPSIRQAITAIVRTEGLRALWKGNGATIIHRYGHVRSSSYVHALA